MVTNPVSYRKQQPRGMFPLCSMHGKRRFAMHIDPNQIAAARHDAPAWALIGLTAPRDTLREDAARCVAYHLCDALTRPERPPEGQLPLPL